MDQNNIFQLLMWGLGICGTGFFFTVGWLIRLNIQMHERPTFKWHEDHIDSMIKNQMNTMGKKLDMISEYLVGTINNPGIITLIKENQKKIEDLENYIQCPVSGKKHEDYRKD